ncbi:MAG TPA: hypothetical protein HPP66_07310 [Planctomycetes bacterium]|nr:hypothetical protein [Planctomycetota bacterium]
MKYCFLMLVLAAIAVFGTGCERMEAKQKPDTNTETKTSAEPITGDEPLLLLDEEEEFVPPTGLVADNSRCFVCHMSYMTEELTVIHARADISCSHCHGDCDAHIADESWAWGENGTAPDIMYPRPKINSFCMGCHPRDKMDAEQHKPLFADTGEKKYCTDCHGNHRLAKRKCKWK